MDLEKLDCGMGPPLDTWFSAFSFVFKCELLRVCAEVFQKIRFRKSYQFESAGAPGSNDAVNAVAHAAASAYLALQFGETFAVDLGDLNEIVPPIFRAIERLLTTSAFDIASLPNPESSLF